ncbi:MAG: class I SAM-dependent methyltransferase, partial [Spirochaetales bacterium]
MSEAQSDTSGVNTAVLAERWEHGARQYEKNLDAVDTHSNLERWSLLLDTLFGSGEELHTLDVGTGPGYLAICLAKLGHVSTGLDFSSNMLSIAREKSREEGVECHWVQGDAQSLP